jgi:hypothetical protein
VAVSEKTPPCVGDESTSRMPNYCGFVCIEYSRLSMRVCNNQEQSRWICTTNVGDFEPKKKLMCEFGRVKFREILELLHPHRRKSSNVTLLRTRTFGSSETQAAPPTQPELWGTNDEIFSVHSSQCGDHIATRTSALAVYVRGPKLHPRDPDLTAKIMTVSPVITRETTMWRVMGRP